MALTEQIQEAISPWWKQGVILTLLIGFSIQILIAVKSYQDAPPIPEKVLDPSGQVVFTGDDITTGQQVFLKYGLMENGSVWGHGAYLGPDFSAQYLHLLGLETNKMLAMLLFQREYANLSEKQKDVVSTAASALLKENRYDHQKQALLFTAPEAQSFRSQIAYWAEYFSNTVTSGGLRSKFISNSDDLRTLTAFFAWTAWVSIASRPGEDYS